MTDYAAFLASKRDRAKPHSVPFTWRPTPPLHDFQSSLVEWALWLGRAAIFADCGLGKTPMQLTWAQNVVEATNRPVLILTPLAVGMQTVREAAKFGVDAVRWYGATPEPRVCVLNYERLHQTDVSPFAGIVCDESSILKNFDGARRAAITDAMRKVDYRLLCTATAAPNDYIELGTSSEALGGLGHMDMLARFFVNDQNSSHPNRLIAGAQWRFRGHAQTPFWQWVATWARACRMPSDLGFDDGPFVLPALIERRHVVEAAQLPPGQLFARAASNMREEREERRRTIHERCERIAALVQHDQPAVVWVHLNDEGDLVEEMIGRDCVQVAGADSDNAKEDAFEKFVTGERRVLVTKPKIGAWGLNWQHCAHVVRFASHSYEQGYQAVRRCWRFGQTRDVVDDIVLSEGEQRVMDNFARKQVAATAMFAELVQHMRQATDVSRTTATTAVEVPAWL